MAFRSCLTNPTASFVADTSVAINLNATGCAETILSALSNRFLVVEQVLTELESGRRTGHRDAEILSRLATAGQVEIVRLEKPALKHFHNLVAGSAVATLDDGEAATIVYALQHNAMALIDERKAIRLCAVQFPHLQVGCTIDLLSHPAVRSALGPDGLADAVFNALRFARMRVPVCHITQVVRWIGPQRASQCASLPKSVRTN